MAQSRWVKERIEAQHSDMAVDLVTIRTTGDKILDAPLSKIGGKGLFVKEIEEALLEDRIDMAVHSMKDVPAELPQGLILCAFPRREDPRDALITPHGADLASLPAGAKVGTGSLRRAAQVRHVRPDLEIVGVRGNVDTRLRKLQAGHFDAIILAAAGLKRLGMEGCIQQVLPPETLLPAVGQGALGIEVRAGDQEIMARLDFLDHAETADRLKAERAFLNTLEGGCQVPIAALARLEGGRVHLQALVAELDGRRVIRDEAAAPREDAGELGRALARKLLAAGAREILASVYGRVPKILGDWLQG